MSQPIQTITPKELRVSNDVVGDPAALVERIDLDGYAYFCDVLDQQAVARLREKYMAVLKQFGVVDADAVEPIWNGADLSDFPVKIEPLHDLHAWESFVAEPSIHAFFTVLLGAPPFWFEITEYRMTPPVRTPVEDPFAARHQDAFFNTGLECFTCWIPLVEIDERNGGLAVVPEMHKGGFYNDPDRLPDYYIPLERLGNDWRRSIYRPGDLVMFDKMTPHSGLPNLSDRFRLSMDIRVAPLTGNLPVIGEVLRFEDHVIRIREPNGREVELEIDESTYCRWTSGARIACRELRELIPVGARVLASVTDGRAIALRPPR